MNIKNNLILVGLSLGFALSNAQASTWHYKCNVMYENSDMDGDGVISTNEFVEQAVSVDAASSPCLMANNASFCTQFLGNTPEGTVGGWGAATEVAGPYECWETVEPDPTPPPASCPAPYINKSKTGCPVGYESIVVDVGDTNRNCCKLTPCSTCPAGCFPFVISPGFGAPLTFCMNEVSYEMGACGTCPATPGTLSCGDTSLICEAPTIEVGCY